MIERLFQPSDSPSEKQIQSGLRYVIKDGVASQAMGILTGGAFLMAFAIKLEGGNVRDDSAGRA